MIREAAGLIKATIYRPSILVGDSKTGRTPTFSGYYAIMRSNYLLRKRLEEKLKSNKKIYEYKSHGIYLDDDGLLVLPVTIPCDPSCGINIKKGWKH